MKTEWDEQWPGVPDECASNSREDDDAPIRLDSLLPSDPETGLLPFEPLRVYLAAFMDLMGRHGQPLTLLSIAADSNDALRSLGTEGARLIGKAMARWLRQETRIHDVVGLSGKANTTGLASYVMVCPLMTEQAAAQFAERLCAAMTAEAVDEGAPWLTLSVGIASLSLDASCPDALLMRAEEALRSAQRVGGGRIWKHSDSLRRIVENHQSDPFDA